MTFSTNNRRGFTLIELTVVIGIIGVLASVVLASMAPAREKARDARRLQDMKAIQTALELYYQTNGSYPPFRARTSAANCGQSSGWCVLETALAPFISPLPRDPLGPHNTYVYYYDSNTGDNYQSYGLMMRPESPMNAGIASSDGGYSGYSVFYEIGSQPAYCMSKYSSGNALWWPTAVVSPTANVCVGGN